MPFAPLDPTPAPRRTTSRWATAGVLFVGLALGGHGVAFADNASEDAVPSRSDVDAAEQDAADKGRDVADVQADLIRANLSLESAGDAAAQAAEGYNGARWRAD